MRHKNSFRKLNRSAAHRRALFRNLSCSLVLHDKIETTLPKAKELKRIADRLVTLGKKDTLANRRLAMAQLFPVNKHAAGNAQKLSAVHKLFTEIAPRYTERHGGYTRVVRTRIRPGDCAEMALIEFVEAGPVQAAGKKRKRRAVRKAEDSAAVETAPAEALAEAQ